MRRIIIAAALLAAVTLTGCAQMRQNVIDNDNAEFRRSIRTRARGQARFVAENCK